MDEDTYFTTSMAAIGCCQPNGGDQVKSAVSVFAGVIWVVGLAPAHAADPSAFALTKLFMEACVPNMGRPEQERAWAVAHHLPQVTNQSALDVFVGPGGGGGGVLVRHAVST